MTIVNFSICLKFMDTVAKFENPYLIRTRIVTLLNDNSSGVFVTPDLNLTSNSENYSVTFLFLVTFIGLCRFL